MANLVHFMHLSFSRFFKMSKHCHFQISTWVLQAQPAENGENMGRERNEEPLPDAYGWVACPGTVSFARSRFDHGVCRDQRLACTFAQGLKQTQ